MSSLFSHLRKVKLSKDNVRNFRVLIIASILNLSFAVEKLLLIFGIDLGNAAWFIIYGGLATYTTILAVHDYIHDVLEENESGNKNKNENHVL